MKKLLIIDDSPFIAKEISDIVSEAGYGVAGHARNGIAGVAMYQEMKPDVVTLDIIMPGIDGIETAEKIREHDPNACIVMLSSLCDNETLTELKENNLRYVVLKPIEQELLLKVLEQAINEK